MWARCLGEEGKDGIAPQLTKTQKDIADNGYGARVFENNNGGSSVLMKFPSLKICVKKAMFMKLLKGQK